MATSLARVCQAPPNWAQPAWPAHLSDCQNAASSLPQLFPNNYIIMPNNSQGCSVVSSYNTCLMTYCVFPKQAIPVNTYVKAVNDIITNCQGGVSADAPAQTTVGGYEILVGTNATAGVFGAQTWDNIFCHTSPNLSPKSDDCNSLLQSLPKQGYVTQGSSTGCSVVARSGTCLANFCAKQTSTLSYQELSNTVLYILGGCVANGTIGGTAALQPLGASGRNVSLYAVPNSVPATTGGQTVCKEPYNTFGTPPTTDDCAQAQKQIQSTYGSTITQTSPGPCSVIYQNKTCAIEFCGVQGSKIATNTLNSALTSVYFGCGKIVNSVSSVWGWQQIQGANQVVSISSPANEIGNYICNPSPNNSPLYSDVNGAINSLFVSAIGNKIYFKDQQCAVVVTSGRAKVNFCSPIGTSFTYEEILFAANNIVKRCQTKVNGNTYVSGIYRLGPLTNVTVYDPANVTLTAQSSCNDLELAQAGDHVYGPQAKYYNPTDAYTSIRNFQSGLYDRTSNTPYAQQYAANWSVGTDYSNCQTQPNNQCQAPTCSDFNPRTYDAGGAGVYLNLISMSNIVGIFQSIYAAYQYALGQFSSQQDLFTQTFDPSTTAADPSGFLFTEVGNGVAGAGAIAGAILVVINPEVAGVGAGISAVAAAILGAIGAGISNNVPQDETIQHVADLEKAINGMLTNASTAVTETLKGFITFGQFQGYETDTLLGDGAYVDSNNIPILNPKLADQTYVNTIMTQMMATQVVNTAWKYQRVWVMSYPMSQADFNNNAAAAGNNDSRLKYYDGKRGYYFQSFFPQQQQGVTVPRVQNPPGWGNVTSLTTLNGYTGFSTNDILQSSAGTFQTWGFAGPPLDAQITQAYGNGPGLSFASSASKLAQQSQIFTIPQCQLDSSFSMTPNLQSFFDALAGPGAITGQNEKNKYAPFCYCLNVTDQQGRKFTDYVDVGDFTANYCPKKDPIPPPTPPKN